MGLFSRRSSEPIVHGAVERAVHVRAPVADVLAHLDEYSSLFSPKHAAEATVQVGTVGGWTAIRLPVAVHPWQLHNLAFWMLDCPGGDSEVIAWSAPGPDHPGYVLVRDPEVADALCGWDEAGDGWTVHVPSNHVVRPEPVPVPNVTAVPTGYPAWHDVAVRFEDPGRDMNPVNGPTVSSRTRLRRRSEATWLDTATD